MPGGRRGVSFLLVALLVVATAPPARSHEPGARPQDSARPFRSSNPSLAVIRPAPDFTLLDAEGQPLRLADLGGRVVLLSFVYTSCPSACPLITQRMAVLQQRLTEARLFPTRVSFVSITVDPERDTADVLARYARSFGANGVGWRFLRESPDRVRPALAAYDEWTKRLPNGEIDHPARLYLIDQRGRVREIYALALFDERQALLDIETLLRENP